MTIKEIVQRLKTAMDDARGQESHFESWLTQNEGICDAIDALKKLDNSKPVAKVVLTETLELPCLQWLDLNRQFDFNGGEYLYTTPQPAQKPWVGLTDEEFKDAINDKLTPECIAIAVEAKLKEKNNG